VLAAACAAFFIAPEHSGAVDTAAKAAVEECAHVQGDRSACYESAVPSLYPKFSVPQLFAIIRAIRTEDPSYQFCHVLAHKIGERVVAEDPGAWIDAIPLNPADGLCSNGFIHGVVGGRFRSEVLDDATITKFLPDFRTACQPHDDWEPSDLGRATCYHGLGHLFDFITDAQLPKALAICEAVAPDAYRRVCIQGVFMQIYQPLEPDDFELIKQLPVQPTRDNVRQFCAGFSSALYVGSCLEESWPLFHDEILRGDVASFCSGQPDAEETDMCYVSMSSIIGRTSLGDPEHAAAACARFPEERRGTCYAYSAQAILEEDIEDGGKALAMCERAGAFSEQCIDQLIDHSTFTFGSNAAAHGRFCDLFSGNRQQACFMQMQGSR
jgi:hypothetical protein